MTDGLSGIGEAIGFGLTASMGIGVANMTLKGMKNMMPKSSAIRHRKRK
jgi:hypothetical protein